MSSRIKTMCSMDYRNNRMFNVKVTMRIRFHDFEIGNLFGYFNRILWSNLSLPKIVQTHKEANLKEFEIKIVQSILM